MTEKRFKIVHLRDFCFCDIQDTSQEIPTFYTDLTYNMGSAIQVCDLLNELTEENEQLKQKLKKYEEIEELKKEGFINCYNCKNDRSVHDGVALDGMCAIKELMNLGGYFDTKYHKLPFGTICPYWELEK